MPEDLPWPAPGLELVFRYTPSEALNRQSPQMKGLTVMVYYELYDGLPLFGNSPCLESEWGRQYFNTLYEFYRKTGQDILEHDGSYPGDVCMSQEHPGHRGPADSQWKQFEKITDFYRWCRGHGIYLNVPDGTSSTAAVNYPPTEDWWASGFPEMRPD